MQENRFRSLPPVHQLLSDPQIEAWLGIHPREVVVDVVRSVLKMAREQLGDPAVSDQAWSPQDVTLEIQQQLRRLERLPLPEVINGTGIILHTGLGRAPLSEAAIAAIVAAAQAYTPLEIDVTTGKRGRRARQVERAICRLTSAEQACVVNNNAASLVLALASLAGKGDVLVSRGELIEIGGGFRLPDIMQASGARLVEVGTTNRTRLADFRQAANSDTAAILKVHPSNYRTVGFVEEVSSQQLANLAGELQIPLIYDVGSGAIHDMAQWQLGEEPTVQQAVAAGADAVLFSCDKLIGGPQAGIIAGKSRSIEKCRQHPLMRAFRVDKLTVAALATTLEAHFTPARLREQVPTYQLAQATIESLRARASAIRQQVLQNNAALSVELADSNAYLGGGSLPHQELPSLALALSSSRLNNDQIGELLRNGRPAVFPRIHRGHVRIDMRTVLSAQDEALTTRLIELSATDGPDSNRV